MVATKKSFKKPQIDPIKIKKRKEEPVVKDRDTKVIANKGLFQAKDKGAEESKKDRDKPNKMNDTRRIIGGQTKSADKSMGQSKPKLLGRKKSHDLTRQTVKKKESRVIRNELINQYLAENSEPNSRSNRFEDVDVNRELSFDHIIKTNKLNVLKKKYIKADPANRLQLRVDDKSGNKLKKTASKSREMSRLLVDGRKSSQSLIRGLSKSQKKLPLREKNLSKAKSMKQLRLKESQSQSKNIKIITDKLTHKIDAINKKLNVIYHNAIYSAKGCVDHTLIKTKKDESGKKKIIKRNTGHTEHRESRIVSQISNNSKSQIKKNNDEFINTLKQLTETHLLKLTELFEHFASTGDNKADREQLNNLAELIEIAKNTMAEYERKIRDVPNKIINQEVTKKNENSLNLENNSAHLKPSSAFGNNRIKYSIALEKPQVVKNSLNDSNGSKPGSGVFKNHGSLEFKYNKLAKRPEEMYSERSSAIKKDQYLLESWRQPNINVVKKHSKDLVLSNIVKTKNSDEHLRSFDRMRTSQAMLSNLDNSEIYSVKEEFIKNRSVKSENETKKLLAELSMPIKVTISENIEESPLPVKEEVAQIPHEDIPNEPLQEFSRVDNITEHVVKLIIEDLFDDYLYRLFFLPERVNGIKTNYTYCKFYLETLMNFVQSKIIRQF